MVWILILSAYTALPGEPQTYFSRFVGVDAEQQCSVALKKKMDELRGLPAVIGRCTQEKATTDVGRIGV